MCPYFCDYLRVILYPYTRTHTSYFHLIQHESKSTIGWLPFYVQICYRNSVQLFTHFPNDEMLREKVFDQYRKTGSHNFVSPSYATLWFTGSSLALFTRPIPIWFSQATQAVLKWFKVPLCLNFVNEFVTKPVDALCPSVHQLLMVHHSIFRRKRFYCCFSA